MAQQILKEVDGSFRSFFGLMKQANTRDRNNKVNDYMNKAARMVIDYCIEHDIGTLVIK